MPQPTITQIVAAEARAALARDGRTLTTLAKDSGISTGALSRKLRGQTSLSVENVVDICRALGVDPGDMLAPILHAKIAA